MPQEEKKKLMKKSVFAHGYKTGEDGSFRYPGRNCQCFQKKSTGKALTDGNTKIKAMAKDFLRTICQR